MSLTKPLAPRRYEAEPQAIFSYLEILGRVFWPRAISSHVQR